ncbi:MAG TPA: hypothetical protein VHZ53_17765 [Steroidobacteraceae bacterium]|jgi:hypothetical protein|nr:hypothetical protein [Steroidobacteraceae bacterium]
MLDEQSRDRLTILKSIVVVLLLANAGYYLWARGIGAGGPAAAPVPSVGTLKLASEAQGTARVGAVEPAARDAGGGSEVQGGDTSTSNRTAAAEPAGGAPADAPQQALLTNVKRCITVGPFRDVAEAAHAASTLRSGGYDPRQRVADGEVWSGVWAYVTVPPAHGAAEQMLAKLKAGGIEDAMEMPGPNDAPVVSLGLYVEPKRAQARVAQAQALGFNPNLSDRKRTGNVYWIDIDLKPTDDMLNPGDLQGESGRIMRLEVKGCPSGSPT